MIAFNNINEIISEIPNEPGCYLMLDKEDRVLYVGKSKKLKNRVRSYFRNGKELTPRIRLMIKQVHDIEFIVTDSESEALTLESNLIKDKQPYFNILLKDDKKYPYLCITWSEEYPRIYITRRRRKSNTLDRYYGPYVDVGLLRKSLLLIKKVFPLRQRLNPLYKDRTCLNYSIGRCPGVCQQLITPESYQATLRKVAMLFQGRSDELIKLLKIQMEKYSSRMEYEKAAEVRDQIIALEKLQEEQKMIIPDKSVSRDVIAMAKDKFIASIQIFQMRSGKLVGRLGYIADSLKYGEDDILQKVVEEHYSKVEAIEIPNEIHIGGQIKQVDLISDWLTETKGRTVRLFFPKRNKKAELIELVKRNAYYELSRLQKDIEKKQLAIDDLASILGLDILPKRIEGYDISHIQGSDVVASQVVFINGVAAKQHYRKYKIRSDSVHIGHSDDYKSLAEVIERRFSKWSRRKKELGLKKLIENNKSSTLDTKGLNDWPDLIMIDGGKGQLNKVMQVLRKLDLDNELNVCSLAKKEEKIYTPGFSDYLETDPKQDGVMLLRRIRDEAHRFALSFHKQQRSKRMKRSTLNEIPGIGPKRIRELMLNFKSLEALQMATVNEITKTPSVGNKKAIEIWNYFHPKHDSKS